MRNSKKTSWDFGCHCHYHQGEEYKGVRCTPTTSHEGDCSCWAPVTRTWALFYVLLQKPGDGLIHSSTRFPTRDVEHLEKRVVKFKMLPRFGLRDQSEFNQDWTCDSGPIPSITHNNKRVGWVFLLYLLRFSYFLFSKEIHKFSHVLSHMLLTCAFLCPSGQAPSYFQKHSRNPITSVYASWTVSFLFVNVRK